MYVVIVDSNNLLSSVVRCLVSRSIDSLKINLSVIATCLPPMVTNKDGTKSAEYIRETTLAIMGRAT